MVAIEPSQGFPWSAVFAVAGTLAGFMLNELSYIWRMSREDRRKVGQALAELLEIRRQIEALPAIMEVLRSRIPAPIPASVEFQIRTLYRPLLPNVETLRQRYDTAVTAVAGAFPVLAFDLRSKDMMTPLMTSLSSMVADNTAAEMFVKMEDQIVQAIRPVLEDLIKQTASLHSRKARRDVDSLFRQKFELPKSFDRFISQALSQAAKQQVNPVAAEPRKPTGT
jgi:hypothetical protein